jgi:hypothetical protein
VQLEIKVVVKIAYESGVSPAAGLKSGQFDQKRNSSMTNEVSYKHRL